MYAVGDVRYIKGAIDTVISRTVLITNEIFKRGRDRPVRNTRRSRMNTDGVSAVGRQATNFEADGDSTCTGREDNETVDFGARGTTML